MCLQDPRPTLAQSRTFQLNNPATISQFSRFNVLSINMSISIANFSNEKDVIFQTVLIELWFKNDITLS